ncbi:MAG: SDR family oxidoreductase [Bdellovibrionota bacterium]
MQKYPVQREKNVLVTGGTRGIGAAVVKEFLELKNKVYLTGTSKLENCNVNYLQADFSNLSSIAFLKEKVAKLNIDIIVNNAGINKIGNFENYSSEDFLKLHQVNVLAPFELCKAVIPNMKKRNWGRIVNISSIFGKISKEYRAAYSSTKFALDGMTIALAAELAQFGILANCVSPGFVDTELTHQILGDDGIRDLSKQIPMKRLGTPQEIAKFILWLSSEENTYLTGQNIAIDGGFSRV